jgi:hypothetical protein
MPRNPLKSLLSSSKLSRAVVLPSAQRTTEEVKAALEELLKDTRMCRIRLEDLLVHSKHHSLLPLLKQVVMSRKKWNKFEFVDTMELSKYEAWSDLQIDMQQEYELSYYVHPENQYLQAITWAAQVKLAKGTRVQDMLAFLQRLSADRDIYQVTVVGFADSIAPRAMQSFVNTMTEQLDTPVMICVASSWWKQDATEWRVMVDACYKALAATVHQPASDFDEMEAFETIKPRTSLTSVAETATIESSEFDEEGLHC